MDEDKLTLLQKQTLFTSLIPKLIQKVEEIGLQCTLGEAWRPDVTARYYASQGKGISHSLHIQRLAIDLNLYRNGLWLKETEDHRPLGAFWKSLSGTGYRCRWGGDWGDGNHYSIEHDGTA